MTAGALVSVVIPTYNRVALVGDAIRSALRQTYDNTEVIVVDDGSTDGTPDRIRAAFPTVRLLVQRNGGVSSARNAGIAAARGAFIAFLDSDDLWHPGKLSCQMAAFREAAVVMVGALPGHRPGCRGSDGARGEWITVNRDELVRENRFVTSSVVVRAETLRRRGCFRIDLGFAEDWELWCRLLRDGVGRIVAQRLVTLRRTDPGLARHARAGAQWRAFVRAIARIAGHPLPAAACVRRAGWSTALDRATDGLLADAWRIATVTIRRYPQPVGANMVMLARIGHLSAKAFWHHSGRTLRRGSREQ